MKKLSDIERTRAQAELARFREAGKWSRTFPPPGWHEDPNHSSSYQLWTVRGVVAKVYREGPTRYYFVAPPAEPVLSGSLLDAQKRAERQLEENARAGHGRPHLCFATYPGGAAYSECYEKDGHFYITNEEYWSPVNYCPNCGQESPHLRAKAPRQK